MHGSSHWTGSYVFNLSAPLVRKAKMLDDCLEVPDASSGCQTGRDQVCLLAVRLVQRLYAGEMVFLSGFAHVDCICMEALYIAIGIDVDTGVA